MGPLQQKLRLVFILMCNAKNERRLLAIYIILQMFCQVQRSILFSVLVQMGKDVVSFLSWAAEPEMEERKLVCSLLNYVTINNVI